MSVLVKQSRSWQSACTIQVKWCLVPSRLKQSGYVCRHILITSQHICGTTEIKMFKYYSSCCDLVEAVRLSHAVMRSWDQLLRHLKRNHYFWLDNSFGKHTGPHILVGANGSSYLLSQYYVSLLPSLWWETVSLRSSCTSIGLKTDVIVAWILGSGGGLHC